MNSIEKTIWDKSIKIIQSHDINSFKLRIKLKEKFPENEEEIENIINEIKRLNLINDDLYNESVMNYLSNKNIGLFKFKMEAKKYGISDKDFQRLIKKTNYNEVVACKLASKKKIKSLKGLEKRKLKIKLMNFLKFRGFGFDTISDLINEIL